MAELRLEPLMPFVERARGVKPTIVLPEGEAPMIAEVAAKLAELGVAKPILLGNVEKMREHPFDLSGCTLFDPSSEEGQAKKADLVEAVAKELGYPAKIVAKKAKTDLDFAAMMVRMGEADCMAAGYMFNTAQTITATTMFIGVKPGVEHTTCFMVSEIPGYQGEAGENGMFIITDTSACFGDTPEELADIAINAADGARDIMGWEPRVAMLSFSTKGSGKRDCATKVLEATKLVKERRPDLKVDGEVQLDTAVVPAIAAKKCGEDNPLGGKANVLVFPNMDAANIGCKLCQYMAGSSNYGPWLQGYNAPVDQLGRGLSFQEITGSLVMLCAGVKK